MFTVGWVLYQLGQMEKAIMDSAPPTRHGVSNTLNGLPLIKCGEYYHLLIASQPDDVFWTGHYCRRQYEE